MAVALGSIPMWNFANICTAPVYTVHSLWLCWRLCARQSRATQAVSSEQAVTSCFFYACVLSRLPASWVFSSCVWPSRVWIVQWNDVLRFPSVTTSSLQIKAEAMLSLFFSLLTATPACRDWSSLNCRYCRSVWHHRASEFSFRLDWLVARLQPPLHLVCEALALHQVGHQHLHDAWADIVVQVCLCRWSLRLGSLQQLILAHPLSCHLSHRTPQCHISWDPHSGTVRSVRDKKYHVSTNLYCIIIRTFQ